MKHALQAVVALVTCLAAGLASAQAWPAKPIHVVIPYTAGGAVDVLTRIVAAPMSRDLGQPIVIEPRPGAEGNIAALAVAKAAPDGYTLLSSSPVLTSIPQLFDNLGWGLQDYAPIARFATSSGFIVTSATLPVKSLKELVEYVKAKPGLPAAILFGGAHTTFTTKMLAVQAGIELLLVPYQGAANHMPDLYEGRVALATVSGNLACAALKNNRLSVLATTGDKRSPLATHVPTTAEAGYPEVNAGGWYGFHAPAGTPKLVVERIARALDKALATDEVKTGLTNACVDMGFLGGEDFDEFVRNDVVRWQRAVQMVGKK
jgi:tripartite-type tricarboxylate transporter receptor subunit TctC